VLVNSVSLITKGPRQNIKRGVFDDETETGHATVPEGTLRCEAGALKYACAVFWARVLPERGGARVYPKDKCQRIS